LLWIESHSSLRGHPKTRKMARMLGIGIPQAIGHLHCLWWWCGEYVTDGDITSYSEDDIADACGWEGDANALMEALINCGVGDRPGFVEVIEGQRYIHDWYEYIGKLLDKRAKDRERQRDKRKTSEGNPMDVQRTTDGCPTVVAGTVPTVPHRTVPTVPKDTTLVGHSPEDRVPYERLRSLWNEIVAPKGTPQVESLSASRKQHIRARWKSRPGKLKEIEDWEKFFAWIATECSNVCTKGWFSFDFLFKSETNLLKTLEGNYQNNRQAR
jgi:hypothetical protein